MPRPLLIALAIAAFAALLWAVTMAGAGVACEACTDVGGERVCQRVRAPTHDEATQTAISNLCNATGRDLGDRLACQRAASTTIQCSDDAR